MAARKRKPAPGPKRFELDRFSPLLDADPVPAGKREFSFKTQVWRYKGAGGWHFANLPKPLSAELRAGHAAARRGWGSIPVRLSIGDTEWETSLFPDRKTHSYLFAIKAEVRRAEGIADASRITVKLTVR